MFVRGLADLALLLLLHYHVVQWETLQGQKQSRTDRVEACYIFYEANLEMTWPTDRKNNR